MTELSPVPAIRPNSWPVAAGFRDDESFDQRSAKGGTVTPLQVAFQRKWSILTFAAIVAALTGLAVKQLPVRYAASASVMLDTRQPRVSGGESLMPSQLLDGDLLRTRMEALHSQRLMQDVVQKLGFTTNPTYCAEPLSLSDELTNLVARLRGQPPHYVQEATCHATVQQVAERLTPAISFSNDGRSYYITITAEAGDAELAAKIANTFVASFVQQQHDQQAGLNGQADAWLSSHIGELRANLDRADAAVEQQRRAGQLTSVRGETLLGQSLAELNSQLSIATSDLEQKRSTLQALQDYARSGGRNADASSSVLASPIIQKLIDREAALAADQADLGTRLGSANSQVLANAAQLDRMRQQIRTEINKTYIAVRGEVQALEVRRAGLAKSVAELQGQVGGQGLATMRLQDFERDAASARSRYDAAAGRLEQIRVEAATQRSDVQPLVEAIPPKFPSFPRTRMIVAGTFMAATAVGAGLAFALALMSTRFTDAAQVEELTGVRLLGLFPKPRRRRSKPQDAVIEDPTSREAEALQAVLANLIGNRYRADPRSGWVLMITSAMPGEGKTSFSVALGRAATARGMSVVVVDCDLRRSTMRSLFSGLQAAAPRSASAAKTPGEPLQSFPNLAVDQSSGLSVLVAPPPTRNPHALLASANLPLALAQLRAKFDVVIVDTPPILAVPDALTLAPLADDVIMLMDWANSPRASLIAALKTLRRAQVQVSGIVLSKVDLRRFARKSGPHSYYAGYYPTYNASSHG